MFQTKTQPDHVEAGWYPLPEIAAIFGMTPQGFHKEIRPLLSPEDVKGDGKRGVRIRARAAIDAYTRKQVQAAQKADPMLAEAESPELERYRAARADIAEMDRDRIKGQLIPRDELDPALGQIASVLRQATSTLQRQFGNEAAVVIDEALNETMSKWEGKK